MDELNRISRLDRQKMTENPALPMFTTAHNAPSNVQMTRLLRPLLEQLLARAGRLRETPLQFEIDSAGVALAVWSSFSAELSAADRHSLSDGARVCDALDLLVACALEDADSHVRVLSAREAKPAADSVREAVLDGPLVRVTQWFDELCGSLRETPFMAIEIVRLRVEGYEPRDIADRLGSGVRLVRRLLADTHNVLKRARKRD